MNKKNTILAIVISTVFIILWYSLSSIFIKQDVSPVEVDERETEQELVIDKIDKPEQTESESVKEKGEIRHYSKIMPVRDDELVTTEGKLETDKFEIEYTSKGGLIKAIKLKNSPELNNTEVDMIIPGDVELYSFGVSFGDFNTEETLFDVDKWGKSEIEFSRQFSYIDDGTEFNFLLKKNFKFLEDEYILDLKITVENIQNEALTFLDFENVMYSLRYGPQIGPEFISDSSRNLYPRYTYYSEGKRQDFTGKVKNKEAMVEKTASWVAIEGKYFVTIAYPSKPFLEPGTLGFDTRQNDLLEKGSSIMFFSRPYNRSSMIEDKYKFYIGPKKKDILNQYKDRYAFDKAIPGSIWGWLIEPLKLLLIVLQKGVKNWGVAIILMTLIIKLLVFPLTQKGFKANTKMQSLAPKANEIKAKYKDDPQKMQTEMAALYKKEGINPLGGCLPLLIQMPIFFALYGLLNSHFELRGAVFIPGWINDLSLPETFITLPSVISFLPVIGSNLRLLPFIMVGTTFIQQRISQNPSNTTGQMKILIYAMPLFFFFIMYNMPSGLVVYWTMQNFLSVFQQLYINKVMKKGKKDSIGIMDRLKQLARRKK